MFLFSPTIFLCPIFLVLLLARFKLHALYTWSLLIKLVVIINIKELKGSDGVGEWRHLLSVLQSQSHEVCTAREVP